MLGARSGCTYARHGSGARKQAPRARGSLAARVDESTVMVAQASRHVRSHGRPSAATSRLPLHSLIGIIARCRMLSSLRSGLHEDKRSDH